MQFRRWF